MNNIYEIAVSIGVNPNAVAEAVVDPFAFDRLLERCFNRLVDQAIERLEKGTLCEFTLRGTRIEFDPSKLEPEKIRKELPSAERAVERTILRTAEKVKKRGMLGSIWDAVTGIFRKSPKHVQKEVEKKVEDVDGYLQNIEDQEMGLAKSSEGLARRIINKILLMFGDSSTAVPALLGILGILVTAHMGALWLASYTAVILLWLVIRKLWMWLMKHIQDML